MRFHLHESVVSLVNVPNLLTDDASSLGEDIHYSLTTRTILAHPFYVSTGAPLCVRYFGRPRWEWSIQSTWNGDDNELEQMVLTYLIQALPERMPSFPLEYRTHTKTKVLGNINLDNRVR
jgi:hypothetical protein